MPVSPSSALQIVINNPGKLEPGKPSDQFWKVQDTALKKVTSSSSVLMGGEKA